MRTIAILLLTLPLYGNPIPEFPFIAVRGEAEKKVSPTQAEVRCTVLCHSKKAEEATQRVNEVLKAVLIEVEKLGVVAKDMEAHDLEKSAIRSRDRDDERREIIGYDVSRRVAFQVMDLEVYPDVIRALMKTDNVSRIDSDFTTAKETEAKRELLKAACGQAREKARLLANATGRTITGVHAVSDNDFGLLAHRFIPSNLGGSLSAALYDGNLGDAPIFVPGNIYFHASVNVLYTTAEPPKR